MNFNNKKIYLIGSVVILAGLFFLASTSSASAGGCSNNEAGLSFSKFLNPLASLAEKVVKGFGYEVALATAPDPDTCGSDDTNCLCSDPNTKLLLHMDGSNGSTNFVDSAQSRSVTANGNAQISTSQYKFGGASGYFDGSGDYLTVPDSSDWTFGTGDFTIDLWVRFSALQDSSFVSQTYLASPGYWTFWYSNTYHTLNFQGYNEAATDYFGIASSWTPAVNTWYHLAVVRSSGAIKLFVNGTQQTLVYNTNPSVNLHDLPGTLAIGKFNYNPDTIPRYLNGYLDELRISKGTDRGWTSNFTPPTQPYQETPTGAPAATINWEVAPSVISPQLYENYWFSNYILSLRPSAKLLLHMDGPNGSTTFTDSMGVHTVTANGNAQISTSQSKFSGASGYFDGSGDYLSVPDSDDWYFGTGDFTIDLWVRFSVLQNTTFVSQTNPSNVPYWRFDFYGSPYWLLDFGSYVNADDYYYVNGSWTPSANTWYHIAVVRNGNIFKLFVNGTQVGNNTTITAALPDIAQPIWIGNMNYVTSYLNGYMDELRISKGISRWTSNFIPPTAPYEDSIISGIGDYNTGAVNSFTTPNLSNNTTYQWSVEAYYDNGQPSAYFGLTGQPYGLFTTPNCAPSLTIVTQPQSQTIDSGQTATLSVSATTSCVPSSLSYQWYRGMSGDTSNPIAGATNSIYTTPSLTVTTDYWVKVTDNCSGSVNSNTATITVLFDFTLNSSNSIYVTILKDQPGDSNATTITVTPFGGFSSTISLSAVSSPDLPAGSSFSFTPSSLTSAQYSSGSQFYIHVGPGLSASQTYTITIQGVDGGLVRTTNVILNAQVKNPNWKEI